MIVPDGKIFAQFEFLSTPEWMTEWLTDRSIYYHPFLYLLFYLEREVNLEPKCATT